MRPLAVLLIVLGLGLAARQPSGPPRAESGVQGSPRVSIADLGHPLRAADPSWSGKPAFSHTPVATFDKDTYAAFRFASEEHFGTHVDAPAHFAAGKWTVDQIPVNRLLRPAACINIADRVKSNDDYRLSVADVTAYEQRAGRVPEGSIALVATGWDARWPQPGRYMNEKAGVKHFPGLSIEAAVLLARDRRVAAIGIDTPSVDYGPSPGFEVHRLTMPLNVYHIENAAKLTTLPASGFRVLVAPINIAGGSGGPARMFAVFER